MESRVSLLSEEDVRKPALANKKSYALDPIRASILSVCLDEILSVIPRIVNMPLETEYFANDWKCPLVQPILNKYGLQPINKNFRPVSNLQLISKLTEKTVASKKQCHMVDNDLLACLQSAY